jgi:hypothetical protein
MDWMLAFAATTAIVTAVVTQVFGILRDLGAARVKRKSEGGYLALRLAAILIRGRPNAKAGSLTHRAKVARVAWCLAASFPASRGIRGGLALSAIRAVDVRLRFRRFSSVLAAAFLSAVGSTLAAIWTDLDGVVEFLKIESDSR